MAFKWIAVLIAGILWGLGADLDFTVAFGVGGTAVFLFATLLSGTLFWFKAFRRKRSPLQLWIGIFRGLVVEALLYPLAGIIFGLTSPFNLGTSQGFFQTLLYSGSGLIGGFLALVFFLIARLLKLLLAKQTRRRFPGEPDERAKKVKNKP